MKQLLFRHRPGTSLIELVLFLAFFAVCSSVVLAFFFQTSEQRVRQQTIVNVEQSGLHVLQLLSRRVRNAERILDPPAGETGSILALQMGNEQLSPTIVTAESGAIVAAEHDTKKNLSADYVTVSDFTVRNTSVSDARPSVLITFNVSKVVPLTTPLTYVRPFEILVTLFPDDQVDGGSCGCTLPQCTGGVYAWEVCDNETCSSASFTLPCE